VKRIVADSGPLIVFARSGLLDIVKRVGGDILVPAPVFAECTRELARPGATTLTDAHQNGLLSVIAEPDFAAIPKLQNIVNLDSGEVAAIALAMAHKCPVLMDERLGRNVAALNGLSVIGSAGILLAAKDLGLIDHVAPILVAWRDWGYFLSPALLEAVLSRASEG
jgi:predicted nucleic acid-binding protein